MRRHGFTLVELLVTITIIGMLAMLSMAALRAVQQSARIDRTKATVAKIDAYVMDLYEFQASRQHRCNLTASNFQPLPSSVQTADLAGRRLDVIRDLMRMELPDHWSDITNGPLQFLWTKDPSSGANQPWIPQRPAVAMRLHAIYLRHRAALMTKGKTAAEAELILRNNESAKLLYLLVTQHEPASREHFREDEIARPDADGLAVFVDAWGNPIRFLRWAPALDQSDVQPAVIPYADATARRNASMEVVTRDPWNPLAVFRTGAMLAPATTEFGTLASGDHIPIGWKMVPLVYSAGPDGIYDIQAGDASYQYAGDPYAILGASGSQYGMGSPAGDGRYDNITNHLGMVR